MSLDYSAFCYCKDGQIYLCKTCGEEPLNPENATVIASGKMAAVAYDLAGCLYLARLTSENKLYVGEVDNLSYEVCVAENVTSFDISRSNLQAASNLVCAYISGGELFTSELTSSGFGSGVKVEMPTINAEPLRVKFARGTRDCNVLLITLTNRLNYVVMSKEYPNAKDTSCVKSTCSVIFY